MMCLGVGPVGGEVGGNGIHFLLKPGFNHGQPLIYLPDFILQLSLGQLQLLCQHLLPFNYKVELVLKVFGKNPNMAFKQLLNFSERIIIHDHCSSLSPKSLMNLHPTLPVGCKIGSYSGAVRLFRRLLAMINRRIEKRATSGTKQEIKPFQ